MPRAGLVIVCGLGLHWILCRFVASSWWVPDLTLLAVLFVIIASPSRWWFAAGGAGLLTMAWTVQFPAAVLLWYAAVGLTVSVVARVWDLADLRVQLVLVGMAETCWIALHLWLQEASVFPVLALIAVHVGLTVAMVPVARRLFLPITNHHSPVTP